MSRISSVKELAFIHPRSPLLIALEEVLYFKAADPNPFVLICSFIKETASILLLSSSRSISISDILYAILLFLFFKKLFNSSSIKFSSICIFFE